MKYLFASFALFLCSLSFSQYVLKWDKQKLQITLPNNPTEMDTVNEVNYFEYIDLDYDFGIELIQKGDEDFEYVEDLFSYAKGELEAMEDYEPSNSRIGKLEGLNSFYEVVLEDAIDQKTGATYKMAVGELVFFHPNKEKLFYFDIEFDNTTLEKLEALIKTVKFY